MTERCLECLRGLATCCPAVEEGASNEDIDATSDNDEGLSESNWRNPPRMRTKRDSALKDQQSTGRKRAATLYPLLRDQPCEWRNAGPENPMGGGTIPIIFGCDRLQQCRHHGPDYNTLNNESGNVWRICHWHHNNYHALNNPYKDQSYLEMYGHSKTSVPKN